jgi:hypothetical protein
MIHAKDCSRPAILAARVAVGVAGAAQVAVALAAQVAVALAAREEEEVTVAAGREAMDKGTSTA